MSKISVKCGDCGKKYAVPDSYAGKRFKCKSCNATIRVPGGTPTGTHQAAGGGRKTTQRKTTRRATRSTRAADQPAKNKALLLLSGIGCVVLIAGIIYVFATMKSSKDTPSKKKKKEVAEQQAPPVEMEKPAAPKADTEDENDPFASDTGKTEEPAEEPKAEPAKKEPAKAEPKKTEPETPAKKEFRLKRIPKVAIEKVAHLDDTPDDVKQSIDEHVSVVADPWATRKLGSAQRELVKIGKPAVPALLSAMVELDFAEEDGRRPMQTITSVLQEITAARNSMICRVGMQGGDSDEEKLALEINNCKYRRAEWFVWWNKYAEK